MSLQFITLYATATWIPFKIPLLWLIQQRSPIVFFCHWHCRAVQRDKSQTHHYDHTCAKSICMKGFEAQRQHKHDKWFFRCTLHYYNQFLCLMNENLTFFIYCTFIILKHSRKTMTNLKYIIIPGFVNIRRWWTWPSDNRRTPLIPRDLHFTLYRHSVMRFIQV